MLTDQIQNDSKIGVQVTMSHIYNNVYIKHTESGDNQSLSLSLSGLWLDVLSY